MPVPVKNPIHLGVTPSNHISVNHTEILSAKAVNTGKTPFIVHFGTETDARSTGCHVSVGSNGSVAWLGHPRAFMLGPNQASRAYEYKVTVPATGTVHGTLAEAATFVGSVPKSKISSGTGAVAQANVGRGLTVPTTVHETACVIHRVVPPVPTTPYWLFAVIGAAVLAALFIVVYVVRRRRQQHAA